MRDCVQYLIDMTSPSSGLLASLRVLKHFGGGPRSEMWSMFEPSLKRFNRDPIHGHWVRM